MQCPICKKPSPDPEASEQCFPFCSDRCKLIDLGRWLKGAYAIPVSRRAEETAYREDDAD